MIDLSNSNVLITGGNGFIGSNFIEYVFDNFKNVTIVNIDKMGVGSRELSLNILEWDNIADGALPILVGRMTNNNKYCKLGMDLRFLDGKDHGSVIPDFEYDYVFHFAAESHVDRSINDPSSFITNNVGGTTKLLDYLKDHQPNARLISVSTDEVYGHLGMDDEPFTEDSSLAPRSPYAASKAAADLVALSYHSTFGMDVVVTRCCNNYGKHQHDEKFIPTVIRSLVEGKKIPVYGNGQNVREWIHVDDHNKAILEIAEIGESGGVYNVGSGVEMSNLEMIRKIIDIIHTRNTIIEDCVEFVEDRKGHDFRYAINPVRWTNSLKQKPFNVGLIETVEFYKNKYK